MSFLLFIFFMFIAMCIAGWVVSGMAKSQKEVIVHAPPAVLAEQISVQFNKLWWPPTQGRGQLNFKAPRPRTWRQHQEEAGVVDRLQPLTDGSTAVQVWMSEWGAQGGMVGLADRVVLKRASLFRALRAAEAAPSQSSAA